MDFPRPTIFSNMLLDRGCWVVGEDLRVGEEDGEETGGGGGLMRIPTLGCPLIFKVRSFLW